MAGLEDQRGDRPMTGPVGRWFSFAGALGLTCILAASLVGAQGSPERKSAEDRSAAVTGPLVLAKQGSFFVNAGTIETSAAGNIGVTTAGHISSKGMYVQYQIPQTVNRTAYPLILVHGSGHSGKTYEETPDGRMGWAEYFVRRGISTYVVDHAGRARSGFDPTPSNRAKAEGKADAVPVFSKFTNEAAWTAFRIGPKPFVAYENTRFPVDAQEQYFAQIVPNTETSYADSGRATVDGLAVLLDRIGPSVVFVHSQSGAYGISTALARPSLVRALVSVEPRSCAVSEGDRAAFVRIPFLTVFGDFFGATSGDWPARMAECIDTVKRTKAAGGTGENIYLPEAGVRGNSHMLMLDTNNLEVADIILRWLAAYARAQ
jgi:pimeloyl-ACP methyl ester carboxylesterase